MKFKLKPKKRQTPNMFDGRVVRITEQLMDQIGFRTTAERVAIAAAAVDDNHNQLIAIPGFYAARATANLLHWELKHYGERHREIVRQAIIEETHSDLWKQFSESTTHA